jgi:light-regulated signal transduction histidine kinase (bacteriophytochrome)
MSDVFSHLFGLTQEALDACAREPIHIPGSIQPRGVLLIATPDTLVITQISINCSDLLGYEPTQLLGQPLAMLFPPTELPIIEQTLRKTPPGVVAARNNHCSGHRDCAILPVPYLPGACAA